MSLFVGTMIRSRCPNTDIVQTSTSRKPEPDRHGKHSQHGRRDKSN
jgi:hypothetical protein